jgi:hypothetical protein
VGSRDVGVRVRTDQIAILVIAGSARMPDTADNAEQKLTLGDTLKDLGWFPLLFASLAGAPSLLALLQMARKEFRLIAALQWIVDGYNILTAEMAAWIEPLLAPAIAWISVLLGWELKLYPHWRPLSLLLMMYMVAKARTYWEEEEPLGAFFFGGIGGPFALAYGALFFGLLPMNGLATFIYGGASALIAWTGARHLRNGLAERDRIEIRYGLTILGGFVVAGLIVAADACAKALR